MTNLQAAAKFRLLAELCEKGESVNFDMGASGDAALVIVRVSVAGADVGVSYPGGFAELVRRIAR